MLRIVDSPGRIYLKCRLLCSNNNNKAVNCFYFYYLKYLYIYIKFKILNLKFFI